MTVTLEEMLAKLPEDERTRIAERAKDLIAEEMTLQDLRKARRLTQQRMAELLGIGQDSISRLEKRGDLLLSTLRGYVAAMGGELRLVVRFPDHPAVDLSTIIGEQEDADQPKPTPRSTARRSKSGKGETRPLP